MSQFATQIGGFSPATSQMPWAFSSQASRGVFTSNASALTAATSRVHSLTPVAEATSSGIFTFGCDAQKQFFTLAFLIGHASAASGKTCTARVWLRRPYAQPGGVFEFTYTYILDLSITGGAATVAAGSSMLGTGALSNTTWANVISATDASYNTSAKTWGQSGSIGCITFDKFGADQVVVEITTSGGTASAVAPLGVEA